jgi:hypothetical protein
MFHHNLFREESNLTLSFLADKAGTCMFESYVLSQVIVRIEVFGAFKVIATQILVRYVFDSLVIEPLILGWEIVFAAIHTYE